MIFLDNVSKSFIKENEPQEILQNISLNVDTGEFLCIVGPSGCGKTSILRLIAGLDFPTSGRITESEIQIEGPSPERGYVFQQFSLFPWRNVLENVTFGLEVKGMRKEERNKKARQYLEMVELSPYQKNHPGELSGGMKQRVAIARSLVTNPHVLLMDEPFSALDVQTRQKLQEELVRIWEEEQKTIIFVTHDVEEAIFLADRVVVLSQSPGRIIKSFHINLERIRDRTSPKFLELKREITGLLEAK